MNQSLYTIGNEYQEAFNKLEELDFDQQTIEDSLSLIKTDFNSKAINVSNYIKNLENKITEMKEAEDSIAGRRKILQNRIKRIRDYLRTNMEKCGINDIYSPYFDIKLEKNSYALKIETEQDIPAKYFHRKITLIPSKISIKADLKKGINVPGCSLIRTLTIK